MEQKPDFFDRLMVLPVVRIFNPLYRKYKEPLLYLFFGGLTTLLSIVLFWGLTRPMHIPALSANVLGWIVCVLFAYVTNRIWVFENKAHSSGGIVRECGAFFLGRVGTLVLEEIVLWIGIEQMGLNSMAVKVAAQVLVIVGNYFISKLFVFSSGA